MAQKYKFILVVFFLTLNSFACAKEKSLNPVVVVHSQKGITTFKVEIADDENERERGLSNRDYLAGDQGMLFTWTRDIQTPFWMKETTIPLDILFISEAQKIVTVAPRTTPLSLDLIESHSPFRYVLEVKAGFVERQNVKEGDKIDIPTL